VTPVEGSSVPGEAPIDTLKPPPPPKPLPETLEEEIAFHYSEAAAAGIIEAGPAHSFPPLYSLLSPLLSPL